MKKFKYIKLIVIIMMIAFSIKVNAQATDNKVPETVAKALSGKYPDAKVKHWKVENGFYVARISNDNNKYFATFDKNGMWIKTTSYYRWPWSLPAYVKQAFKTSGFYSWHVYFAKKVETPSGDFYQLMIDDANTPGVEFAGNLTTDRLLEFAANGTLTLNKDITGNPVP